MGFDGTELITQFAMATHHKGLSEFQHVTVPWDSHDVSWRFTSPIEMGENKSRRGVLDIF